MRSRQKSRLLADESLKTIPREPHVTFDIARRLIRKRWWQSNVCNMCRNARDFEAEGRLDAHFGVICDAS